MKNTLRIIYTLIPFKLFFFKIVRRIWTPSHEVYKHLHFQGKFNVIFKGKKLWLNNYNSIIETSVFWTNSFEEEKMSFDLWEVLCGESKKILDIGANVGLYSLVANITNKEAEVIAFEPIERIYNRLRDNISLNKLNIETHQLALSNKNEKTKIYDLSASHHYHASLKEAELVNHNYDVIGLDIDVITLDYFFEKNKLTGVDLMKIDVEGLEKEVIEGGINTIKKYQPSILVEIKNEENANQVQKLLGDINYSYYDIDEKNEKLIPIENLRRSMNWNLLLLNPKHNELFKQLNVI